MDSVGTFSPPTNSTVISVVARGAVQKDVRDKESNTMLEGAEVVTKAVNGGRAEEPDR